jgi:branched-chain amino acid transport system permease protein
LDALIVTLLNGVAYGLLLFMIAAGLTVVFGLMGVLNFAHTAFYMVGAYVGFVTTRYAGFWAGLVIAPLLVGALGLVVERTLLAKVRAYGHAQELLLTFGLAYVITEIVKIVFGPFPVAYNTPEALRFLAFHVGAIGYPFARVFVALVSIGIFLVTFAVLRTTRVGLIVRAASENARMVSALGHNVPRIFSGLFAFSAALAGLGGAIGGAIYSTGPAMASDLAIIVFIVVVIGGLGSLNGAFFGAIALGLATSLAVSSDATLGHALRALSVSPPDIGILNIPVSATAGIMPYLVMLAVLLGSKRVA